MKWALLGLLAACPRAAPIVEPPVAVPSEGISIAIYLADGPATSGGLVDDRRWVEVTNDTLVLDRIDPAADLQTLLVEPLDRQSLTLGACTRQRIDLAAKPVSWQVTCRVAGTGGRRFVRVLHVAPAITFRINHRLMADLEGDDHRATLTTRFSITTPPWSSQRAQVALYDRPPGGEVAPNLAAGGSIVLDGGVAVLGNPKRTLDAYVRSVFDGAIRDADVAATEPVWGRDSKRAVHTVLDLERVELPAGAVDIRITSKTPGKTRDVTLAVADAEKLGAGMRFPLWVDDTLSGVRRTFPETFSRSPRRTFVQRLHISVANASDVPRDVWVEERLRPAHKREISGDHPKLVIADNIARMHVVVPPRGTEQMTLTISYEL